MWQQPEYAEFAGEFLLAGQKVGPGLYKEIGTGRLVELFIEDLLPATLDGRVGCYVRISNLWSQFAPVQFSS